MAKFKGIITLNNDFEKDTLTLTGEKETLAIVLALVDPALIIQPKISNKTHLMKLLKSGVSTIKIAIGDSEIPKEVLIETLKFCEVKK